eukprot:gnl/TRDRNA2_/TRDRNA2_35276_c0_seq1.p1 gnl/TRDRNA2_/TRDRNA2_35276_c0~~gnl/TRDRNA2_/TRDRNA2_35276_c0_seq1.p1  ORF type:complete len:480 (+),score=88.19 gnl/TRDRNA2_/TRDRNA2_35276_c0_seq1:52-1440(+)
MELSEESPGVRHSLSDFAPVQAAGTGPVTRVSLHRGGGGSLLAASSTADAAFATQDRSLAAAKDYALFAAPGETSTFLRYKDFESSEEVDARPAAAEAQIRKDDIHDPVDTDISDETVYLTEAHRLWESHYLKRLAMRVHRLAVAELNRAEEALFMMFSFHDTNLDGCITGEEATSLLDALGQYAPGIKSDPSAADLVGEDGSITFLSLLQWYGQGDAAQQGTSARFNVTSAAVGLVGSGRIGSDSRLDALDWASLRRNIVGYRKLLRQVRSLKLQRKFAKINAIEEQEAGLLGAMPAYYAALAEEFEGDGEALFLLFLEADTSGSMMLEEDEVVAMLHNLDTGASEDDIERYLIEINVEEGPLSFASFLDWWDQSKSVDNSLVAEKGTALVASVKARAYGNLLGSYIYGESLAQRRWQEAAEHGPAALEELRDAYVRTLTEVREYKMQRDLRIAERECVRL